MYNVAPLDFHRDTETIRNWGERSRPGDMQKIRIIWTRCSSGTSVSKRPIKGAEVGVVKVWSFESLDGNETTDFLIFDTDVKKNSTICFILTTQHGVNILFAWCFWRCILYTKITIDIGEFTLVTCHHVIATQDGSINVAKVPLRDRLSVEAMLQYEILGGAEQVVFSDCLSADIPRVTKNCPEERSDSSVTWDYYGVGGWENSVD